MSLALSSCLKQTSVSLGALEYQQTCFIMAPKTGPKKWSKHGCDKETLTVATGLGPHKEKRYGRKSACTTCADSSEILRWVTHFWSKYGPKWGPELDHIFIPSFRSLLEPRFRVQIWTQKWVSHRRILLLPAEVLQADLRRTSMSISVNTCCFSLCVPLCFLYSRGPFLAAMFLLFFWILFGSHDEAGLLAFEALQGLPRPARGTHGRSYCGRNRL